MKQKLIAPAILACLLAACGSPKEASNSNFEKAINKHYAKDCITIHPFAASADGRSYPITVALQEKAPYQQQAQVDQSNALTTSSFDALVDAGVLSVATGTKQRKAWLSEKEFTVPAKIYSLTDAGKKALVQPDGADLCVGHYKVDDVTRFSEPSNALGHTISEVAFTMSAVDVPDWAKNDKVAKQYRLDQALAPHIKGNRTLVLASDGWIDSADFSN
ncbi:hypothetical protein [Caballeronia sp. Lep1P3]|uniref:hypothetical protein n=1 Tax=Caballeronia sp. Lep1P3 TaxID=2878150 RepID=UPI001FD385DA|nr:hypothetical protein [Caballeronia sp. Lep1P3]